MTCKRKVLSLAAAAALLLGAGASFAQQTPGFIVSSTPFQARSTGVTETAGDVVMTTAHSGAIPAGTSLLVFMIPAAAAITNDPIINDNNLQLNGMAVPGARILVSEEVPNLLIISFTQQLDLFVGDQIRIRSVRLNLQAAGLEFPDQIRALFAVTPPGAMLFDSTNIVGIATPLPTLTVTPPSGLACPSGSNDTITCSLRVVEAFPGAWTSLAQETAFSNTPPPTHPTQLQILLTNVAGGLTVDVPATVPITTGFGSFSTFIFNPEASTGCDATGRCADVEARDISLIYNVTGAPDVGQVESAMFNFRFTAGDETAMLVKGIGVQVRLAPISATPERARFDDTGDRRIIPRFLDRLP